MGQLFFYFIPYSYSFFMFYFVFNIVLYFSCKDKAVPLAAVGGCWS